MKSLFLPSRRAILASVGALLLAPRLARAGTTQLEGFSIWVPSNWVTQTDDGQFNAHSGNEALYLRAQLLDLPPKGTLATAPLEGVVDDELDDYDVLSDNIDTSGPKPLRVMEGSGEDEGDDVLFRMVALPAAQPTQVALAMVYGEEDGFQYQSNRDTAARILASLSA